MEQTNIIVFRKIVDGAAEFLEGIAFKHESYARETFDKLKEEKFTVQKKSEYLIDLEIGDDLIDTIGLDEAEYRWVSEEFFKETK